MKFLSQSPLPRLTITRRQRQVIFNHVTQVSTMRETVTRVELTLPSIVTGIRDTFNRMADSLAGMFLPRVYAL